MANFWRFCRYLFPFVVLLFAAMVPAAVEASENRLTGAVLQSASELDYPPFAVVRPDGGADGFSVGLLKAVANAVGMDVRFTVGPWNEIKKRLIDRDLDVLPLVSRSPEREPVLDFTAPYLRLHGTIFVREGETGIRNEADLAGRSVLVMKGDTAYEYAVRNNLTDRLVLTDTFEEAMRMLSAGQHDAVIIQQLAGHQLVRQLGITNLVDVRAFTETSLKPEGRPLFGFEQKFCIAVAEGDKDLLAALNEGLAIVIANGTYDRLYDKWFAPILPSPPVPLSMIARYLTGILVPLLFLLSLVGLLYMRREVARKTERLTLENRERRIAEAALRESEERHRSLYVNTPIPYQSLDEESRILDVNPAWLDTLGHGKEEVLGRSFTEFLHPDGKARFAGMLPKLRKEGAVHGVPLKIRDKGGRYLDVSFEGEIGFRPDGEGRRMYCVFQDVTERKQAEDELRRSRERYRIVADFTFGWEYWISPDNRFEYISPSCERITGYPPEAFRNDPSLLMSIVHPDDRGGMKSHLTTVDERPFDHSGIDFRIITADGNERWISHFCMPVFADDGRFLGRRASNRDITSRKQGEKKLVESEARFRELFDNMSSGVAIYDSPDNGESFVFRDLNRAGLIQGGKTKEEVVGQEVREIFPGVEELGLFEVFQRVWRTGKPEHLPSRLYRDAGREIWVQNDVLRLPSGELVAIYEDTTARRQAEAERVKSEERLNLALDSVSDAVWDWRVDTGEVYFSSRWFTMLGYEPGELPVEFETWRKLLHPEDLPEAEGTVFRHLESGEPFEIEFRMKCREGGWKWILGRGKTVETDPAGKAVRMLGTHMDITERKRIELQLQQAQKMESIGNLAGGIAHDFNNILAPIVGLSEMLMEDLPTGSFEHENAAEILEAGKRGRDLVKHILAFSRQSKHEVMPVRLPLIAKEVLKLCRSTIPSNIEIEQEIDTGCGPVMADPTQLHQIAMNLMTNAFHAVEKNGGKITLSVRETTIRPGETPDNLPEPGKYAELSVADTGVGIDPSVLDKIFDPYFTTKEKEKGTGLGLAVVYGIVKEHRGEITVASELGRGTAFSVFLPVPDRPIEAALATVPDRLPFGNERILLVDDEEPLVRLQEKMLERLGYVVTARTASEEALETFRRNPGGFDLVITDMTMPNMTGDQLTRKIRAIRPHMPVIICSGFSERLTPETVDAVGVNGILLKPVGKQDMAGMVRKVLDGTEGTAGPAKCPPA